MERYKVSVTIVYVVYDLGLGLGLGLGLANRHVTYIVVLPITVYITICTDLLRGGDNTPQWTQLLNELDLFSERWTHRAKLCLQLITHTSSTAVG